MIEMRKIKDLVKLMVANDLTELDLQGGDGERVTLKRGAPAPGNLSGGGPAANPMGVAGPVTGGTAPATNVGSPGAGPAGPGASGTPAAPGTAADDHLKTITCPMVGTFYSKPGPDAKLFVNVGDTVKPDQVVCLIEAMKVFNEIKAEVAGRVEKVLVENGQAVEFGQPLFLINPG